MLLVAEPILGEEEKAALSDVVDSGVTKADRVRDFERAFAEKHGAEDGARPARQRQASDGGYGLAPLDRIERGPGADHFVVARPTGGGLGASPDGIQHMMAAHAAT